MSMTKDRVRVYWAPGCSSCLRTKEFLTRRGVDFESINVAADPSAMERLFALGARSVPIVARGDNYVYAQTLADITAFLQLDQEAETRLPPASLVDTLNKVLHGAIRYLPQVPEPAMDVKFRDFFTPRQLAQHIFRVTEAFVETLETPCEYSYELMMRGTHAVVPGDDIAAYGRDVAKAFTAWWDKNPDRACTSRVTAYWGEQSLHDLLERTAWHSAQHTRQLISVLDEYGIEPQGRLTANDLMGLPLPQNLWGEADGTR